MQVSIVMAAYNGSKYIEEQLTSILSQSFKEFELIIVNDKSSDNTPDILNDYKKNDSRVSILNNKENAGCSKSFEIGLSHCKGEYILLCDQDDIWESNKIDRLISNIGNDDLIYSNCKIIDANGVFNNCTFKDTNNLLGIDSETPEIAKIAVFNSFILGCSIMFRRDCLEYLLPILDNSSNHDKWIVALIAQKGTIRYLDEELFNYRIHDSNLSFKSNKNKSLLYRTIRVFSKQSIPLTFREDTIIHLSRASGFKNTFFNELSHDINKNKLLFIFKYFRFMFLRVPLQIRIKAILIWCLRWHSKI